MSLQFRMALYRYTLHINTSILDHLHRRMLDQANADARDIRRTESRNEEELNIEGSFYIRLVSIEETTIRRAGQAFPVRPSQGSAALYFP